jgi:DNA-binding NarL/FixJ family response regulator
VADTGAQVRIAECAPQLEVSERTVNFHFGNILSRVAVANRVEAIAVAIARGIIVG